MAESALGLFGTIGESGSAAAWSNLTNVLAESGFATATLFTQTQTNVLEFSDPVVAATIPAAAIIQNIEIVVSSDADGFGGGEVRVRIGAGSLKTAGVGTTPSEDTFTGDLTYWGIDQNTARDFVDGTVDLDVDYVETSGTVENFDCTWAKAKFTYEATLITVPVLF